MRLILSLMLVVNNCWRGVRAEKEEEFEHENQGLFADCFSSATAPYPVLRSMSWRTSNLQTGAQTRSIENDGNGSLLFVKTSTNVTGTMDPATGTIQSTWSLHLEDEFHPVGEEIPVILEVTTDGESLYLIEATIPCRLGNCFSLVKVDRDHKIVKSSLISVYLPRKNVSREVEQSYMPSGMTYNPLKGTLMVLSSSDSRLYEYTTDLKFTGYHDQVLPNEAIAWDSRLCNYWAVTKHPDKVQRLDWAFQELESWPVKAVNGIAVIENKLFLSDWCNTITVLDVSESENSCQCSQDSVPLCLYDEASNACSKSCLSVAEAATRAQENEHCRACQPDSPDPHVPFGTMVRYFEDVEGSFGPMDASGNLYLLDRFHTLRFMNPRDGSIVGDPVDLPQPTGKSEYCNAATDGQSFLYLTDWSYPRRNIVKMEPTGTGSYSVVKDVDVGFSPSSITYNNSTGHLLVLAWKAKGVKVFEYTTNLELVRKLGSLPFVENFAWDPRLCSYWTMSENASGVQRLDWNLRPIQSFMVGEISNLAVAGHELVLRAWFSYFDLKMAVYDIEDAVSDCACDAYTDLSTCPNVSLLFCKYYKETGEHENLCVKRETVQSLLRSGGYCGPCSENHLIPQGPGTVLRQFDWTIEIKAIEHDGNGNLFVIPLYEEEIGIASTLDGSMVSPYQRLPPGDGKIIGAHASSPMVLIDVASDGNVTYALEYSYEEKKNTGKLLRLQPDRKYKIEESVDLYPLKPVGITRNSVTGNLFVLAETHDSSGVHVYEYTPGDFALVKRHDVPNLNSLKWDPTLFCYWGSSYTLDLVERFDENFQSLEAIQVEDPQRVAVIGTELIVQVEREHDKNAVVVYDIGDCKSSEDKKLPAERAWDEISKPIAAAAETAGKHLTLILEVLVVVCIGAAIVLWIRRWVRPIESRPEERVELRSVHESETA